ncbi:hypothetical protein CFP56_019101 [Quercus suber]|uniref:Uncharacterized protein n=1 Tax=Quercus suber TaxID=58331 RepID=A0AAW0LZV9_QUESU
MNYGKWLTPSVSGSKYWGPAMSIPESEFPSSGFPRCLENPCFQEVSNSLKSLPKHDVEENDLPVVPGSKTSLETNPNSLKFCTLGGETALDISNLCLSLEPKNSPLHEFAEMHVPSRNSTPISRRYGTLIESLGKSGRALKLLNT